MTTQSAISGQSFGTSTNVGNDKFSINPLTLGAGTTAYVVNVQVTPGAGPLDMNQEVQVFYTTTMRTVTAANAPYTLGQSARYVTIKCAAGQQAIASVAISKDSTLEPVTGSKFHCWVNAPKLETAASLSVDLVELP